MTRFPANHGPLYVTSSWIFSPYKNIVLRLFMTLDIERSDKCSISKYLEKLQSASKHIYLCNSQMSVSTFFQCPAASKEDNSSGQPSTSSWLTSEFVIKIVVSFIPLDCEKGILFCSELVLLYKSVSILPPAHRLPL